ncbi:Stk1 family PASTA domain-containing Ser/Thr kinase [Spongisporangium articulatum]|uniref:non-specific serine/threonine protein kinase n=1 Tax=Spongisporangium articulatum TaxID=3362603 RepID=A0ABW8AJ91_9ACTN
MNESPRVLGNRYEVGEILGRGGMAEVHLGRDARLGRTVAIKLLRTDLARDPLFQARFRREAQSAAALNHPAIVAVYDTGEEQITESGGAVVNLPYIVMEYVEGRTLREEMGQGGQHLGVAQALDVTAGVLAALEYSHRMGIVHRDIKPANVMLTPAGDVKVMDFGIARAMSDASSTMTQTQAVIGTAQYLSPEQARGEPVDTRSDLYSTGCMLYELLTGRPPFVADSPVAVAYQHVREEPVPPSRLVGGIPHNVDQVVLHSLAKGRDERYQTAAEFRADVEAARAGQQVMAAAAVGADAATTQYVPPMDATGTRAMGPVPGGGLLGDGGSPFDDPYDTYGQEPGRRQTRQQQPSGRGPLIAGIIVVLLVLGVGGAVYALIQKGNSSASAGTTVPDVVGQTKAKAEDALDGAGFKHTATTAPSTQEEKGNVIDQTPDGNTEADPSTTTVQLVIGAGPSTVTVPPLAGKTYDEAEAALNELGLKAEKASKSNPDVEVGTVIDTEPAAGESAAAGQTITVNVANNKVKIPDVGGLSLSAAQSKLSDVDLKYRVSREPSDEPTGTVIGTNPKEGTTVTRGYTVTIVVADPVEPEPSESASPTATATATESPDPGGILP